MAKDYGTGVSRTLQAAQTQLSTVIYQKGKPPMDAEFSLAQDLAEMFRQQVGSTSMPSGWLGNGVNDQEAFLTNPTWSNWFRFGRQKTNELGSVQWAAVNGWLIPVTGTLTGTPPGSPDNASTWNKVTLGPPPSTSGGTRVDFVFLEVWQALISPNPSTTNKPSASGIWRYGNVEGGYSFLSDDLVDPALGFETSKRVQIQYRIRVVQGMGGLTSFPDGFDPAYTKAQGAAAAVTAYTFTNMRTALGDPGLWRAGDGTQNALGTVDGYTYAVPIAAVFRRNSVAWDGDPGQNLNGGFNRNPTAVDRTGVKTFSTVPTLAADMDDSQLTLTLTSASNIPLPTTPSGAVTLKVGDEFMTYTSITGTTVTLGARGALGSRAEAHVSGVEVQVVSGRPDGLFADQVAKTDILDLRHAVSPNGFDYEMLLRSNLDALLRGQLRSMWKATGASATQGSYCLFQDKISSAAAALGVTKLDAPDGLRQIWSDASLVQPFEFIADVPGGTSASESIGSTLGFPFSGNTADNSGGVASSFKDGAILTLPIAQFQNSLPGSDQDQVSFPKAANSSANPWVKIRLADSTTYLDPDTDFSVTTPTGPGDDLVITLSTGGQIDVPLFITFHVQYGSGRGISRRPNSIHDLSYLVTSAGTYLRQRGAPNNDTPISVGWAPLWSKFRSASLSGNPPITAESYVDPGSKTVILSPFRQIDLPDTQTFYAHKDDDLHGIGVGVMPASGDPLGMFSTVNDPTTAKKNTFTILPRNLVPGYGDLHVPIIHTDSGTLVEGVNYMFDAPKGNFSAGTSPTNNFIAFANTGDSKSFATFSTIDLTTAGGLNTPATYNALTPTVASATPAGMRFYTDTSGAGREGLELPPYYGPSRLFAVYEAEDFATNGSAYDPTTRNALGSGATNLLRQDVQGPTMWVTLDSNSDSTFVLNAEAIDITKSPNAIADFASGHYVLEMTTFGFDRGFFDLSDDARLVLPRLRGDALDPATPPGNEMLSTGVQMAIPAPPQTSDSIGVNYSRTVYQGDAFQTQLAGADIPQALGPLSSSNANQVGYTDLDLESLSLPNPKVMEVLSAVGFETTLGTGRLSGDFDTTEPAVAIRSPGYQDASAYPPTSPVAARPDLEIGGVLTAVDGLLAIGTDYHGCIEGLPLGALHRSADFRGEALGAVGSNPSPLLVNMPFGPALESTTLSLMSALEQHEVPVTMATPGAPGALVVHVDGEPSNYALLTNYRTARGGSVYVASGDRPGGALGGVIGSMASGANSNTVLAGMAYLVRLSTFAVGVTERNAGGELMMLIVTTATRKHASSSVPVRVLCSTSGTGEGFSAADLYRLAGRPLVVDGVRADVDLANVQLAGPVSLKPRIGG